MDLFDYVLVYLFISKYLSYFVHSFNLGSARSIGETDEKEGERFRRVVSINVFIYSLLGSISILLFISM